MRWFPDDPNAPPGIFVIEVPAQDQDKKHFLVERMLSEQGKPTSAAVGVPRREGDRVEWLRAEEIHGLISNGLWASKAGPSRFEKDEVDRAAQKKRAAARLDEITKLQEWADSPRYFLQALPPPGGPRMLPSFHDEAGIRGAFPNPPKQLRATAGFNLQTHRSPDVRDGGLVYFADPRKALWLDLDGLFTAGVVERDFLGWKLNDRAGGKPLKINSLVLVEFTKEFFRFVHEVLKPRAGSGPWSYSVSIRSFRRPPGMGLASGTPVDADFRGELTGSPDAGDYEFEESGSAGKDALEALKWIYTLFGHPASAIPFVRDGEISDDEIRRYLTQQYA
jgi:hypothetical protein